MRHTSTPNFAVPRPPAPFVPSRSRDTRPLLTGAHLFMNQNRLVLPLTSRTLLDVSGTFVRNSNMYSSRNRTISSRQAMHARIVFDHERKPPPLLHFYRTTIIVCCCIKETQNKSEVFMLGRKSDPTDGSRQGTAAGSRSDFTFLDRTRALGTKQNQNTQRN